MTRRSGILALAVVFALAAAGLYFLWPLLPAKWVGIGPGPTSRPAHWAAPMHAQGVINFYKVSDGLYRGAQPDAEGIRRLKGMGIKTIINLRKIHSDRDEIGQTDVAYEHISMTPLTPDDEEVTAFLRIVTDGGRTPVFVHCQRGADRTGFMCAVYRICVQGWGREEAIVEMTGGGFGYASTWKGLVRYLREMDVSEMRRRAGLEQ